MTGNCYLGIDMGTGGVRCILMTADGRTVASADRNLNGAQVAVQAGRHEQQPQAWWQALVHCVRQVAQQARNAPVKAAAVDSTSGTVVFLDDEGKPLRPAIMYNDGRAAPQTQTINAAAAEFISRHGYRFGSSYALAKVLWVKENEPELFEKTRTICHAADYLAGRLLGSFSFSDTSNSLKMGCDLFESRWPDFIPNKLGIPLEKLPRLKTPGQIIGTISAEAADELRLPRNLKIAAGCTDGTAGFLASGAANEGDWSSTLGTTLVLRGISSKIIKDTQGRMYCHRHPDGWWLPGAACSVGGECLEKYFGRSNLAELDRQAEALGKTDLLCYPLARRGERFPFVNSEAEGFFSRKPVSDAEKHLACLEGVAFVERWALELFNELNADTSGKIFATGGGAKSDLWLQIRATVLGREIAVPEHAGSEVGAAVLAAAADFDTLSTASKEMICIRKRVVPNLARKQHYDRKYQQFRSLCAQRGYA